MLPTTLKNQGKMLFLWFRLARRLDLIDLADWLLSRKGDFIAERSGAARAIVDQLRYVRPSMIKTWIIFTHGY